MLCPHRTLRWHMANAFWFGSFSLCLLFHHLTIESLTPRAGTGHVLIEPGESVRRIATALKNAGAIQSRFVFLALVRLRGVAGKLQAGEYRFETPLTVPEVIAHIVHGKIIHYTITVPEGLTSWQIAALLEKNGFLRKEDFLQRVNDPAFARSLGIESDSLEGYLFPSSYELYKKESAERVIRSMVAVFKTVFDAEMKERAAQRELTLHEAVTLASLIEKETKRWEEASQVASVFVNRLSIGMKLDCDPTVRFTLQKLTGHLTKKDMQVDSPYNTYRNNGLPPGPIANPGEAALRAALWPSRTKYFYFVATEGGYHHFSETFREHLEYVNKHQKIPRLLRLREDRLRRMKTPPLPSGDDLPTGNGGAGLPR